MRQLLTLLLGTLLAVMVLMGCRKNGTGGNSIINIHVIDSNSNISDAIVKIKFGATGNPGPYADYDLEDTSNYAGLAKFQDLRRGDYYIRAYSPEDSSGNVYEAGKYVKIENRGEQHIVIEFKP